MPQMRRNLNHVYTGAASDDADLLHQFEFLSWSVNMARKHILPLTLFLSIQESRSFPAGRNKTETFPLDQPHNASLFKLCGTVSLQAITTSAI